MKVNILKQLLSSSWNMDTCSPKLRSEWNEANPSLGQSACTSLIVNDVFGGKIMKCSSPLGVHYYNVVEDKRLDLTEEQFLGKTPNYPSSEEVTRKQLLSDETIKSSYKQLIERVRSTLIDMDFEEIDRDNELNKYRGYLNKYYMFCTFEIIEFKEDEDFEYVKFDLAAQNTGLIVKARHNKKTDEYDCDIDTNEVPIPVDFLKAMINLGRKYKDNLELENVLTTAYTKSLYNIV